MFEFGNLGREKIFFCELLYIVEDEDGALVAVFELESFFDSMRLQKRPTP